MTTAEAAGHVCAGLITGAMMLAGGWWLVLGLVLLFVWIMVT